MTPTAVVGSATGELFQMTTPVRAMAALSLLFAGIFLALWLTPDDHYPIKALYADDHIETSADPVVRGRYLVQVSGCNDCHTPGYLMNGGSTPESEWMVGSDLGWRGPWGTTYAVNVRAIAQSMSEQQWLSYTAELRSRPPMPWFGLVAMTEADRRDMWAYLNSLEPRDDAMPAYQPPGEAPAGVFVDLTVYLPDGTPAPPSGE